jgi:DNA repair protein RadD
MSDIWKVFSKAELQELIGPQTLERLDRLMPALSSGLGDPDALYYKETLSLIFDAFSGPDAIAKAEFRRRFLNHLKTEQIDSILRLAGIVADDLSFEEKVERLVSKGWNDVNFCRHVVGFLGLPETFLPVGASSGKPDEVIPPAASPLKPLKDFQFDVFRRATERLDSLHSRFVVQMPTGSGKTRTAMEIISTFLNSANENEIVVWLAHSEELCDQAYECFLDVWSHVGHHELRLVRCWGPGAHLPYDFKERALIIGGFQKLHSLLTKNEVPFCELRSRIVLVVVDEAHKVLAPTYKQVTRALLGDSSRVIGLTATPGRSVLDAEENEALAQFFFNQMISITTTTSNESVISFLRRRGVLAEVVYEPLLTQLQYDMTESELRHLEQFFDIPPGLLRKIGSDDVRNIEILKRLQRECEDRRRIIFFACSIEHSKFICAMLVFLGFRAAHIDGATPRSRRKAIIDEFKKGELQVICNFGVLSTGFDAPKTDVVFISRPTASIVLYSQMIGRGLRGPAIGGTETCKVVDVKDNIIGFSNEERVYEYFDEYFNGKT